jgi:hypothetical protein
VEPNSVRATRCYSRRAFQNSKNIFDGETVILVARVKHRSSGLYKRL